MKRKWIHVFMLTTLLIAGFVGTTFACRLAGVVGPVAGMDETRYNELMGAISTTSVVNTYGPTGCGAFWVTIDPITYEDVSYDYMHSAFTADDDDSHFPNDYDADVSPARLMLAHIRNGSAAPSTGDPHPFIYNLYGEKTAFAHNGSFYYPNYSLGDECWDDINAEMGEFWNLDIMDREWRGTDSDHDWDEYNDSEVYAMLMNKNYMIARNYGFDGLWAVYKTMEEMDNCATISANYTSQNFLFTDTETMYAIEKHRTNPSTYYDIMYDTDVTGTTQVFSSNMNITGTHINNLDVLEIESDGTVTVHNDYADSISNLAIPGMLYVNENTAGAQNSVSISRSADDGSFAAVWEHNSGICMRWYNQLGLAEDNELFIDPAALFDGDYVLFSRPDVAIGRYTDLRLLGNPGYVSPDHMSDYFVYVIFVVSGLIPGGTTNGNNIVLARCVQNKDTGLWSVGYATELTNDYINYANPRIACDGEYTFAAVWQQCESKSSPWDIKGMSGIYNYVIPGAAYWQNPITDIYNYPVAMGDERYNPDVEYTPSSVHNSSCFTFSWVEPALPCVCLASYSPINNLMPTPPSYPEFLTPDLLTEGADQYALTYPRISRAFSDTPYTFSIVFQDYTGSTTGKLYTQTFTSAYDPEAMFPVAGLTQTASRTVQIPLTIAAASVYPDIAARSNGNWDVIYASYESNVRRIKIIEQRNGAFSTTVLNNTTAYRPTIEADEVGDFPERRLAMWYGPDIDGSSNGIAGSFDPPILSIGVPKRAPAHNEDTLPMDYALEPVYPNPFNAITNIRFALPEAADVSLRVFNIEGRQVAEVLQQRMNSGKHIVSLDANKWSSGVYLVQMRAGGKIFTQKAVLVK